MTKPDHSDGPGQSEHAPGHGGTPPGHGGTPPGQVDKPEQPPAPPQPEPKQQAAAQAQPPTWRPLRWPPFSDVRRWWAGDPAARGTPPAG